MTDWGALEWTMLTGLAVALLVVIGIGISDWWVLRRDAMNHKGWQ